MKKIHSIQEEDLPTPSTKEPKTMMSSYAMEDGEPMFFDAQKAVLQEYEDDEKIAPSYDENDLLV